MAASLDVVYSTVLQNGIRKFKYKNSHLKPVSFSDQSGKGAIFAYRSKEHMIEGIGLVITSEEGVIENNNRFTHWTPNVFRYGTYADEARMFTKGHSEDNLRQINTFFVDFDTLDPNFDYGEIILASHEIGFMPTMILRTPHGFQAFYVLDKPAYVTKKSNFKVINVAKMISKNLRNKFSREQIKERYMETYPTSTVHASRLVASYFIKLQEMTPGDVILIPYLGEYHFFEVEGKYFFDNEEQDIALKQRIKVKFIKKLNKNSFSTKFRKSIGVQPTLTYLGEYKDEIESALLGDDPISLSKQKAFVYTESSGSISLSYSDNISKKILKEFFDKVLDEI